MKRICKPVLLVALLNLVFTSCFRSAAKPGPAAIESVPVRAAQAAVEDVPVEVAVVGNVEAMQTVDVKSRVAGQIKRVAFEEGETVAQGQLLFTIDLDTLQRQATEQQAEIERDDAMAQQARAVLERDSASQKQSQLEANNAVELAKEGILSRQSADQLIAANDVSRATLRSAQAAVNAAAGAVKADRARLAQTQLQMNFTDVVAPISGRTGAVTVKAGNVVREGETTLVTIRQLSPVAVAFGVPEQILAQVQRLNAKGALSVGANAGNSAVAGRLTFIDNVVDSSTGTIRLKAEFSNTGKQLWPGQFVNVRLRLSLEPRRLVIPESCIQDGQKGKYVWVIQSNVATITPVTIARIYKPENGPELAVLEGGLRPGASVVTDGQIRLTSGARVNVLSGVSPVPAT